MSERNFQMRLTCRYRGPDNEIAEAAVQNLEEGEWRDFILDPERPGFLILVYAILNCQHRYLCMNAAERGIELDSARGVIDVGTDEDWRMQRLRVRFEVGLRSGAASPQDIDYIVERMRQCPVSVNLRDVPDAGTSVEVV